ncbi:hypothetical protein DXG03_008382, partial [Asterophora parasitica]
TLNGWCQAGVAIADGDDPALVDVLVDWEAAWEAEVQRAKSRKGAFLSVSYRSAA